MPFILINRILRPIHRNKTFKIVPKSVGMYLVVYDAKKRPAESVTATMFSLAAVALAATANYGSNPAGTPCIGPCPGYPLPPKQLGCAHMLSESIQPHAWC